MTRMEMQIFLTNAFEDYFKTKNLLSVYSVAGMRKVISAILKDSGLEYYADSGAEKFVVIFEDFDYVLKIPLIDTECREYELYLAAEHEGIDDFFAYTYTPFGVQAGKNILWMYFQEKIKLGNEFYNQSMTLEDTFTDHQKQMRELCRQVSEEWSNSKVGEPLLKDFRLFTLIPLMCGDRAEALLNFLMRHRINDLWSANYACSKENGLIFFDFSGYESGNSGLPYDEEYYEDEYEEYEEEEE